MTSLITKNRLIFATAVLLVCAGSGWVLAARGTIAAQGSAMVSAVLTVMIAIGINAWRAGQATVHELACVQARPRQPAPEFP